ncbi:MAG: ABC transporter permease, partial [Chloroflexi bacterium]|nr:ABC transporter permease [Chloroflexota bacterium]
MKLGLYWSYATRSLLRGGQRTVLAIFCVTVGVMAIVALQLVGLSVNQALIGNIVEANGGDIRLSASVAPLRQQDLTFFNQLKQKGLITDYATANDTGGSITLPSGDEVNFSFLAISSNFPLVGQASFIAPSSDLTLQQVVNGSNVAMSEHVFQTLGAHIGSTYRVKTLDGRLIPITVAAEFQENGIYRGPRIIISQAALAAVPTSSGALLPAQYDTVYMTVPDAHLAQVKAQINQAFPSARASTAQDLLKQRQREVDQIQLFLRTVGLLALFIGGIGIINTMQVLLRRRQVEIAMLKTTGYRQFDLYGLFGLEAALLGVFGGITGAAAGIGASYLVRIVVERTFSLHLPIILDTPTIVSGLLIGLATALIFGLLPIVQASQIRPMAVLRESHEGTRATSRLTTAVLLTLLSLLFVALASTILGDVETAAIAVYGGAGAIFALALGLGLLVVAISRLPVYEQPSPRILLWMLAALGSVILTSLAFGLLGLLGEGVNMLAVRTGNGTLGIYALAVLAGLGIVLLAGSLVFFLATLVDSLLMFAPRSWKTPVMLAYRNIGRQRIRTTTTLTALFVGIFAIGLVLVLGQGIKDTISATLSGLFTHNVFVAVPPEQQDTVTTQLLDLKGVDPRKTVVNTLVPRVYPLFIASRDLNTVLKSIQSKDKINRGDVLNALRNIEGFELKQGGTNIPTITLKDGRNLNVADAGTNDVIVNAKLQLAPLRLHVGDTLIVQSADGSVTKVLKIVGFYDNSDPTRNLNFGAILADEQVAMQLGGPSTLKVFSLQIDPEQLPSFKRQINKIVPGALIISVVDIDALINQVLDNLIIMLTTVASLAMIAGLIIIANAVALAMLERQREIGILKSVGYTSRSVLATVIIENGLVGMLGSLVAMLLVAGA